MGGTDSLAHDQAVVGWRYWQLSTHGPVLRSVSHRRFEWAPGRPLRAWCTAGGHAAPAERCNCGIYAARDLDTLRGRGMCLAPGGLVVGEVALWGRVASHEDGYRGELAYPRWLALVEDTVPQGSRAEVLEALAAYGVPVGTMPLAKAVGEVSAAVLAHLTMSMGNAPLS